jgi:hypothetical protein
MMQALWQTELLPVFPVLNLLSGTAGGKDAEKISGAS